jgi:hypothetical protein
VRGKLPYWALAFILCYFGAYFIINVTSNLDEGNLPLNIFSLIVFSVVFSYGVICLMIDIKMGGIHAIIIKIKQFFIEYL